MSNLSMMLCKSLHCTAAAYSAEIRPCDLMHSDAAFADITGLSPEVSGDDKGTWLAPVIQTTLSLKASLDSRRDPSSFRSASALNANASPCSPDSACFIKAGFDCASMHRQVRPRQSWYAAAHRLSCKSI